MGILDDAGVVTTDIPKDPFGFQNDFHVVEVFKVRPAAESSSGKQFGTMITFKVIDDRWSYMETGLGFGQWLQLPSPKWLQDKIPFDPNTEDGKKILFGWGSILKGLSYPADQMGGVNLEDIVGKRMFAKIFPKESDFGWSFRVTAFKPIQDGLTTAENMPAGLGGVAGSDQGMSEFSGGSTNSGEGMSEMEKALAAEANGG